MKKRIIIAAILLLIIASVLPVFTPEQNTDAFIPTVISESRSKIFKTNGTGASAAASILIDADSGRILYANNENQCLPMASTTKIMTAVVVLDNLPMDYAFTIPKEAVGVEGSSIYLREGETLTCEELIYGLLLESGNDAAVALAIATSGSVEEFVRLMNKYAYDLGLESTHFANPHGLPDDDHYTTASDLAALTAYALKSEVFTTITSTWQRTISDGYRYLVNHNKLLKTYEGMIGVKTGYTRASGRCLVTAAERDGVRLVAVTLNGSNDRADHKNMLDFGFEYLTSTMLALEGTLSVPVPVVGGKDTSVSAVNTNDLTASLPSGAVVTSVISTDRMVYAPVKEGDIIGEVVYYCGGEIIASCPLVAAEDVNIKKLNFFERLFS